MKDELKEALIKARQDASTDENSTCEANIAYALTLLDECIIIRKSDVPEGLKDAVKAINYVKGEYSAGCLDRKDVERAYQVCGRLQTIEKAAALIAEGS